MRGQAEVEVEMEVALGDLQGRASFEQGGGGGRGFWTQNLVYQKWPDQIFPIVNFVFSHYGHFGLGRGGGGFGGGPPPPWLLIILKKPCSRHNKALLVSSGLQGHQRHPGATLGQLIVHTFTASGARTWYHLVRKHILSCAMAAELRDLAIEQWKVQHRQTYALTHQVSRGGAAAHIVPSVQQGAVRRRHT